MDHKSQQASVHVLLSQALGPLGPEPIPFCSTRDGDWSQNKASEHTQGMWQETLTPNLDSQVLTNYIIQEATCLHVCSLIKDYHYTVFRYHLIVNVEPPVWDFIRFLVPLSLSFT